uniref:Aminopeptidase n=1 Tax=Phallusia mammillata TaxID=59560 RepID=A0A6F9DMK7_9ASCI|nr:puromycin-sensitive aminopeptidase-like [Phallusia mammillata]
MHIGKSCLGLVYRVCFCVPVPVSVRSFSASAILLSSTSMAPEKKPFSRLPTNVTPLNYNLWLKPCLSSFVFDGKQAVKVKVSSATPKIVLNCVDISISSASFVSEGGQEIKSNSIDYEVDQEKVTVQFPNDLPIGDGVLNMSFKGELNNKMKGFYRSKYVGTNGEEKYAAVTQFEATDARRCFPCWDEPALKASFDTTLVVPKELVALSNMNVVAEDEYSEDNTKKVLKYAQTPIMSTYLLAFVVGEFDFVEGQTPDGIKVRVYTPVGKSAQGTFALEVAVKVLPFYENYFGIKYPLAKMDLIAVADFCAGAMENWGLVTYRETALLIDDKSSSAHTRQWVALVVCHELAHQWFGNLVTMEWWTHLWLNEGFASFMEYLATDHCHPKFDIWTQFITHDLVRAMDLDALDNSHPIEIPVGHPDEVDEIFDIISYSKGASVIRMLHNWIGDSSFQKGMNLYLNKHAYKNAFTEDLWESLGEASGKPVEKVMSTWTSKMGYPVLDVKCKARTDNSVTLQISQSKFRANNTKGTTDDSAPIWSIPVAFSTSTSPLEVAKSILMEDQSVEVTIDNVPRDGWVKVNPGLYGFYRVRYSADLLTSLISAVKDQSLPARDRLGLQGDLFALASSGVAPTTDFLQALAAYENETNYTVWNDVSAKVSTLNTLLWNDDQTHENFKKFTRKLFQRIADNLGWDPKDGEGHLDSMLRSLVIGKMGGCGCDKTVSEANNRLGIHVDNTRPLNADLRSSVYGTVLSHGGGQDLETLLKLHQTTDLHEERNRIEKSLGHVKDPELIKKVLDFSMSERVRSNDRVFVIGSMATCNKTGRNMTWEFTKATWDKLHDMYKGMFLISRLVKQTTENFATDEMAKEVEEFFSKNPAEAAERTVQQSIEQIKQKSDWWKRDGQNISDWLKQQMS